MFTRPCGYMQVTFFNGHMADRCAYNAHFFNGIHGFGDFLILVYVIVRPCGYMLFVFLCVLDV